MIQFNKDIFNLKIIDLHFEAKKEFNKLFKNKLVNELDYLAKKEWLCNWMYKKIDILFKDQNFKPYHWYIEDRLTYNQNYEKIAFFMLVIEQKNDKPIVLFSNVWPELMCSCFYDNNMEHLHNFDWIDYLEYVDFNPIKSKIPESVDDAFIEWEKENKFISNVEELS